MQRTVLRILIAFTVGFLLIGAILALVKIGDCGSVLSPADGCADTLGIQRSLVIVFIGLGLTAMAAAIIADWPSGDDEAQANRRAEDGPA